MMIISPKKSLGQNFLKDKNIARKIVKALGPTGNINVIEIGPGTGALTGILLDEDIKLTAVELDERAFDFLKGKYCSVYPEFNIIRSDIRDVDINNLNFKHLSQDKLKVIGNIPYNISSDIFFWLFENSSLIDKSILTVQKEVALRLAAKPGTKSYGILTVAMNLVGKARILFDIPPSCFFPQPAVTSSCIELNFDRAIRKDDFSQIMAMVREAFNQRRKKLKNALKNFVVNNLQGDFSLNIEKIEAVFGRAVFNQRAEELDVGDFVKLRNIIFELKRITDESE